MIILPILTFVFIVLFLSQFIVDIRKNWIIASVVVFSALSIVTEILGWFSLINRYSIIGFWTIFLIISSILILKSAKRIPWQKLIESIRIKNWRFFWVLLTVYSLTLLLISLYSAPSNWDSMTYHLSRIMHWVQNGNLEFYPTNILRQLNFPPFSEVIITHLYLLTNDDRMMNLVQWFSYASIIITISLLTDEFSGGYKSRVISAVLAAAIPMAIMQSTTTQNDLLVGYLIMTSIWFFFRLIKEKNLINLLFLAFSVSLALYTKTTAYIYLLPLLLWLSMVYLKKFEYKTIVTHGFTFILVVVVINGSHYTRNFNLWDNPLGEDEKGYHLNKEMRLDYTISNLIRNTAMQFETPNPKINKNISDMARAVHNLIGIDFNDPNNTFQDEGFGLPNGYVNIYSQDHAPNPLPMALVIIAIIFALSAKERNKNLIKYVLYGLSTLVLFSTLLRWQPWQSRLLLPFFYIFIPIEAIMIEKLLGKLSAVFLIVVFMMTIPYLLGNPMRPIFGKNSLFVQKIEAQYFNNRPNIEKSYLEGVSLIKKSKCNRIGLNINGDDYEYPIWALLKEQKPVIQHYPVDNITKVYYEFEKFASFQPCAVINTNYDSEVQVQLY